MNIADQMRFAWRACLIAFFAITLSIIAPTNFVKAEENKTQISNIICNAVNQLTGPIGRAIAILIIISLAISLFLGKVSWGMAIAVAVGMGILFGAKNVVELLAGNGIGSGVCDPAAS
jgi:type IV secretion system protein VirB2